MFNHHSMDQFIEVTLGFSRLDSKNVYNIFSILLYFTTSEMTAAHRALCIMTVGANKYWRGHNGKMEHHSFQFKACMNYNRVLTGGCSVMTDMQLGKLKGLL